MAKVLEFSFIPVPCLQDEEGGATLGITDRVSALESVLPMNIEN